MTESFILKILCLFLLNQFQLKNQKMRSRTELVTTTIDNSDLSDTDLEDSEDDWKPSADNVIIVYFFFSIAQN